MSLMPPWRRIARCVAPNPAPAMRQSASVQAACSLPPRRAPDRRRSRRLPSTGQRHFGARKSLPRTANLLHAMHMPSSAVRVAAAMPPAIRVCRSEPGRAPPSPCGASARAAHSMRIGRIERQQVSQRVVDPIRTSPLASPRLKCATRSCRRRGPLRRDPVRRMLAERRAVHFSPVACYPSTCARKYVLESAEILVRRRFPARLAPLAQLTHRRVQWPRVTSGRSSPGTMVIRRER